MNARQTKNLAGILAETGQNGSHTKQILRQLQEPQAQETQISGQIQSVEATIGQSEGRIISAEVIVESLKTFGVSTPS